MREVEDGFSAGPDPELFPEMAQIVERLGSAHSVFVLTSSRTADVEATSRSMGSSGWRR